MTTATVQNETRKLDILLLGLTIILTTIGILLVFDASYAFALDHSVAQTKYVGLQALWGALGIAGLLWASRVSYWKWRTIATSGLLCCVIALVLVYVPHIGILVHKSHRWIGHGQLRVQPSEFAKFFVVLFIARSCAGNVKVMSHFFTGPGPGILAIVVLALLTAKEPDLGTALLITLTGAATLFFAGMKWNHVFVVGVIALTLIGGLFALKLAHERGSYQMDRILVFLHPEEDKQGDGYQVYHSMLGLGSGGLSGVGIGEGREKLKLPEADTDFIFEVMGEEGGLIGSLLLLGLIFFIAARGMHIACNTRDRFGSLLAAGMSFGIGIQAMANVGVATASIPNTGVPLPFVSYGGSSLLMCLLMVGILLNIAKNPDGDPNIVRKKTGLKSELDFNRRWRMSASDRPVTSRVRSTPVGEAASS